MRQMVLTAALMGVTVSIAAQARPNFQGTWVFDAEQSRKANASQGRASGGGASVGGAGAMGGGSMSAVGGGIRGTGPAAPAELRITQTAEALTIDRTIGDQETRTIYKLDGSESVNTRGPITTRTKSQWKGNTLVTEGTQVVQAEGGERTVSFAEVRSIDAAGALVVVNTRQLPTGPVVTQQIYTQKK